MELADKFFKVFQGMRQAYGTYSVQTRDGQKLVGKAQTIREEVTVELWQNHLEGKQGVGIIPIDEENNCYFGAIDIDQYPIDHAKIASRIRELNLPLIPCRSKSGGVHAYLFINGGAPAGLVQAKLKQFAVELEYGDSEIFPKQIIVNLDRGDLGSWINMPYFNAAKSDRYGVFPDGTPMDVEDFLEQVAALSQDRATLSAYTINVSGVCSDGPYCLQHLLAKNITSGNRNIVLHNVAMYLIKKDSASAKTKLIEINETFFKPPLAMNEVDLLFRSVSKRNYQYDCNKPPLSKHCNKEECANRPYGIQLNQHSFNLSNLTKYDSDPPIWFVTLDGLNIRLELETEDLQNQIRFANKCLNTANILPPKFKGDFWADMVQTLLKNLVVIEAPKDTSLKGQFFELLEKFCTARVQAKSPEEVLLGKPWVHDNRHFFQLSALISYLDRNHFKDLKLNKISSTLKDMGGENKFFNIKGKGVNLWSIPEFSMQTEGYEVFNLPSKETM